MGMVRGRGGKMRVVCGSWTRGGEWERKLVGWEGRAQVGQL